MKRTRLFIGIAFVITAVLVTYALSNAQALVEPIKFELEEQNASGETGTVTLTDLGSGKTKVEVTVSGQPSESSQPLQVHEGQCGPTLARIAYPLNDLEGGKSTTTIDASLGSLTTDNSRFAINSHKSEQEYTVYVLCGNIPSLAQVAQRATATQQALEALQTRPPGGIAPVTFSLEPENDSGQSGTVTLTDLGGAKTMVQVSVTGEPAGAVQPLHIHEGQCGPTLARLAFQLEDLVDGKSSTTIDASVSSLTTEGFAFAINSHKSQKEYTVYVLCGNIPSVAQSTGTGAATPAAVAPTAVARTAAAVASTATVAASAATAVPPTATVAAPAVTAVPPTATVAAPTATVVPPTATVAAPTATLVPPTATVAAPTASAVPPTSTVAAPSATAVPPTATVAAPSATAIPPTATVAAPAATSVQATATAVAPTATVTAPTATSAAPTSESAATAVAPTSSTAQPTAVSPTTQAGQATAVAPTDAAGQATTVAPTATGAQATAVAPTTEAGQATAVAPTTDAGQATAMAPTPAGTATTTPAATIPESGGNPYSGPYLGLTIVGILVVAAGLSLMQLSQRGSSG